MHLLNETDSDHPALFIKLLLLINCLDKPRGQGSSKPPLYPFTTCLVPIKPRHQQLLILLKLNLPINHWIILNRHVLLQDLSSSLDIPLSLVRLLHYLIVIQHNLGGHLFTVARAARESLGKLRAAVVGGEACWQLGAVLVHLICCAVVS